jgi:aminoglycoside/choline kinase family phosphotransferase
VTAVALHLPCSTLTAVIDTAPPVLHECLSRLGCPEAAVHALTPDASDRRYFRIQPPRGDSVVVALHAQPFQTGSLTFTAVAALFEQLALPVPRVRAEMGDLGILVLDDLGDTTLQAHLQPLAEGEYLPLYEQAVDYLVQLQREADRLSDRTRFAPFGIAFDVDKLMWEMDFFLKHFLEAYRGLEVDRGARASLRAALARLVETLAAEPRVLCHRDYHSRNLMLCRERLWIIDFQDARLGPNTYDLVSLLRDSYVELSDAAVDALTARFIEGAQIAQPREFAERFRMMALQRNLKALGTFGYQAVARANPVYAQYVPRTLGYVRRTLHGDHRFSDLRDQLVPLVSELR